MAIAKIKPDAPVPLVVNLPTIEPDGYRSVLNDDRYTPLKAIISYVAGAPWIVAYYSQVLSRDNDLKDYDPSQPNVYQQYTLIHDLEIRVDTPIANSQDPETGLTAVSGSAYIYPMLVPNTGDVFIAALPNNEQGLFRVKSVERKALNRYSAFLIEYDLINFLSQSPTELTDLNAKVIREYYYHKDRLIDGLQPNVTLAEHQTLIDLRGLYYDIVTYYFDTFYQPTYASLVVPGQSDIVYDGYIVDYLLKITDTSLHPHLIHIKNHHSENDLYAKQRTLWSVLLARNSRLLAQANRYMTLTTRAAFSHDVFIRGLMFQRFTYIVYPKTGDRSSLIDDLPDLKVDTALWLRPTASYDHLANQITYGTFDNIGTAVPYIKPVLIDADYVLSEAFYNTDTGLSLLEFLTTQYLMLAPIDSRYLYLLANQYTTWGRLEQFYYLPILMTLIKANVSSLL